MSLEHSPQRETGTAARHEKAFLEPPLTVALEPLLTVEQLSKIIGRTVSTLEKDRWEGGGPPYVKMGRHVRNGYLCRCPMPSHGKGRGDRNPSLSIAGGDDGKPLVHCFGGCDPRDVLATLRARGLFDERRDPARPQRRTSKPLPLPPDDPGPDPTAVTIWRSSEPIAGTLGEIYLRLRGITLDPPPSLRFLQAAEYPPSHSFPGDSGRRPRTRPAHYRGTVDVPRPARMAQG
jgi:hypothetical protein